VQRGSRGRRCGCRVLSTQPDPGAAGQQLLLGGREPGTHSASPSPTIRCQGWTDRQNLGPQTTQMNPATPASRPVPVVGAGTARPLTDPRVQPGVIRVPWARSTTRSPRALPPGRASGPAALLRSGLWGCGVGGAGRGG